MQTTLLKDIIDRDKLDFVDADISYIEISRSNSLPLFNKKHTDLFKDVDKNFDLAYGEAIIVTSGDNLNGFYFTNEFILNTFRTFTFKPVNIEHMQQFIVGVIYDSAVFRQSSSRDKGKGKMITDPSTVKADEHIEIKVRFALFQLIFPGTIGEIIGGAQAVDQKPSTIKVSMELFPAEYGFILNQDESTFKPKTKSNAFLDQFVGRNFKGNRISRMYIKGTFVGMGIVEHPADLDAEVLEVSSDEAADTRKGILDIFVLDKKKFKRNVIIQQSSVEIVPSQEPINDTATSTTNTEEKNFDMKDELKKLFKDLSSELASDLESKINSLMVNDDKLKVDEARQQILVTEIANKAAQIQERDETIEENKSTLDASKLAQEAIKGQFDTEVAKVEELEKEKVSLTEEVANLKTDLIEYKASEIGEERIKQLSALGITYPEDKQKEKTDFYGKMDETVFAKFLESIEGMQIVKPDTDNSQSQEDQAGAADAANLMNGVTIDTAGTQIPDGNDSERENAKSVMKLVTSRKQREAS